MYLVEIEYYCSREKKSVLYKCCWLDEEVKQITLGLKLRFLLERIEDKGYKIRNVNVEEYKEDIEDYCKLMQEKGRRD